MCVGVVTLRNIGHKLHKFSIVTGAMQSPPGSSEKITYICDQNAMMIFVCIYCEWINISRRGKLHCSD